MDRLLVIGASGLLGAKSVELGKKEYAVYGTYNTHDVKGENLFQLDVTKRQDVFKGLEKVKPDFVIDTHSVTNVDSCETNPEQAWSINVDGTKNVAEACKTFGAKMAFLSTDYVFDGRKTSAYTEKDKPRPLNYYGKTKLVAEKVIETLDPDFIIVRTAVLYGKGGSGKVSFPLWVMEKLKNREQIKIVIDQYNNPTFVDNLVEIMFGLYEKDAKGLFHVVGADCISRYDFARLTAKVFGLDDGLIRPITTPEMTQTARRPEKLSLSTEKAQRMTKIKPLGAKEGLAILKKQIGDNQ